jgi:hypothetical protein
MSTKDIMSFNEAINYGKEHLYEPLFSMVYLYKFDLIQVIEMQIGETGSIIFNFEYFRPFSDDSIKQINGIAEKDEIDVLKTLKFISKADDVIYKDGFEESTSPLDMVYRLLFKEIDDPRKVKTGKQAVKYKRKLKDYLIENQDNIFIKCEMAEP